MRSRLTTTAATLKSILCFIDPENTPKIAYDNDEYAEPLINKIKGAIGDSCGSQPVSISFYEGESELRRQFSGIVGNIQDVFSTLHDFTKEPS